VAGCDHTLRFSETWAQEKGLDVIEVFQFLNGHGGFCDCEVIVSVEMSVREEAEG